MEQVWLGWVIAISFKPLLHFVHAPLFLWQLVLIFLWMVNTLEVTHRYLDSVWLVAESAGHDSSKGLLYLARCRHMEGTQPACAPGAWICWRHPSLGCEESSPRVGLMLRVGREFLRGEGKQEVLEGCVGNKQSMQDSIGVWWKKLGPSYRRADHRDWSWGHSSWRAVSSALTWCRLEKESSACQRWQGQLEDFRSSDI